MRAKAEILSLKDKMYPKKADQFLLGNTPARNLLHSNHKERRTNLRVVRCWGNNVWSHQEDPASSLRMGSLLFQEQKASILQVTSLHHRTIPRHNEQQRSGIHPQDKVSFREKSNKTTGRRRTPCAREVQSSEHMCGGVLMDPMHQDHT